ncbi:MAG: cohesin domain-containing protein [Clostridia bacterium]|nr:cohesin domain-containing protein [Clostridia bacterium]
MKKKVIIGVIIGVIVLAVAVLAILFATGNIKLNLKAKDKSQNNPTVSETAGENSGEGNNNGSDNTSKIEIKKKSTGKKTIEVKDVKPDKDGTVTVPVYATKNEDGIGAVRLYLDYDMKSFDFAELVEGDMFDDFDSNIVDGQLVVIATKKEGLVDVSGAGVIINVKLVPKKGIKNGEYNVNIDSKKSEYAIMEGKLVHPTVQTGKIIIG